MKRHDGVEVIPIVSRAHELVDDGPENEHEQPEQARHDVAIGTIRKKEPQGEVGCNEEAASTNKEVGREVNQRQTLHRMIPSRSLRITSLARRRRFGLRHDSSSEVEHSPERRLVRRSSPVAILTSDHM